MWRQTDSRWADLSMGSTTIGKEGCLLVSIFNANLILGNQLSPDILLNELSTVGGLKEDGDLVWTKLPETSSLIWLYFEGDDSRLVSDLEIVEYERPSGSHFVLKVRGEIVDPKPGTECGGVKSIKKLAFIDKT